MRLTRVRCFAAAAMIATFLVSLGAQRPDMSGTWKLDAQRSKLSADAQYVGLMAAGAPPRIHVTRPANGTLIVESETNEGHVRIYTPRAKSSTPVFIGPAGTIAMTSKWQDARTLVSEGTYESSSGPNTIVKQMKEVIALAPDDALTIEITASGSPDKNDMTVSTLVYTRTQDVGPCETWSTPCKRK